MNPLRVGGAAAALARIRIVLVDTLEPGNIGSAARAMKTMGLSELALVRPARFPHESARRMAVSAADVLERACVHAELHTALADCHHVYAVSARQRKLAVPIGFPRQIAPEVLAAAANGNVALVFGGEEAGLNNADLELCATLVQIPSDPRCRSLNLAAAVQLIAYELRLASLGDDWQAPSLKQAAPVEQFEGLISAIDAALADASFYANKNRELANARLRRIFQRAQLNADEIKMLRGAIARLVGKSKAGLGTSAQR